jgi:hypothetical protein
MRLQILNFLIIVFTLSACQSSSKIDTLVNNLEIDYPQHGFISLNPASRWEESLISGNGSIGLTMPGNALQDRIVFGHEKLIMPEYQPYEAPDLGSRLPEIREAVFNGNNDVATMIVEEQAKKVGIEGMIWTNPPVPACQLEFESLDKDSVQSYVRSTNFATGEITVAYHTGDKLEHRNAFVSRTEKLAIIKFTGLNGTKLNYKFALNPLPVKKGSNFRPEDYVDINIKTSDVYLHYNSRFKKQWNGSVKGHDLLAKIVVGKGEVRVKDNHIVVTNADEITILADIHVTTEGPVEGYQALKTKLDGIQNDYDVLLSNHEKVHSEIYNRFSFNLCEEKATNYSSEELMASSLFENTNPRLVEQLVKAARYNAMSSAGELPPTLQGIWGGTWRPMWSGDFTLNGNVQSAIASGLNTNLLELTDSYLYLMNQMKPDFEKNAKGLYGVDGIYVPSRVSDHGSVYHFGEQQPHLFWNAGTAWAAHFYYDRWLYTCDTTFLKNEAIPFLLDAYKFLSKILYKTEAGKYIFIPSYSPEIGPLGVKKSAINATMDVAAMKQLLRNLITLVEQGFINNDDLNTYKELLTNLPDYAIDKNGELKEWIWDGYENNNSHRHASHLYPLYDGIDPEFLDNPELQEAAKKAIESRLIYRRDKNGAEMSMGLVQLGLAAAHLGDTAHAYECIRWLCNSYWTPGQVSYTNPGEIFNLDISGGLPAVVSYMLLQSSPNSITLLPCLPPSWPKGNVKGIRARGGFIIDIEWVNLRPVRVIVESLNGNKTLLRFNEWEQVVEIPKGSRMVYKL